MATISGVEEVSPGFFKVHESIGGHGGGGWDDRDWFADQGLDIRDYRVASLILEPAINCTVARIRRTYRRADDPDDEVSPPARGSGGTHIGDPNGGMFEVLLGRDEFITAVGGVSARVRSCSPTGNCVDRLELRTSAGRHFVVDALTGGYQGDKMGQKSELAPAGGYVVAGFWGRSGFSVDRLGLYLAPLRWRAAVHGAFPADFRSQVRTLLLAHRRLRDCAQQGHDPLVMDMGTLPIDVLPRIVERLAEIWVESLRCRICTITREPSGRRPHGVGGP